MEGNDSDRESSREWIQAGGKAGRLLAPAFFLAKKKFTLPFGAGARQALEHGPRQIRLN